ncbi:DUF3332 domain-containing protein [Prevotella corporis]|uniref:DUF3332 domain-containing protein n=1 Tax=Prevotella corporis TaxID=28128 RepID=UPI002365867F|nr:DUF3332 domain-containing protein [Prevotella corporis]
MKRKGLKTAVCLMTGTVLMSSCVGSFAMFNKLASWNKRATDSKFLNELIFIVISPAYAFAGIADALVLNTIEFWTGDNPMAKNIGKTKNIKGDDGLIYAVKYLENGYEITKPNGDVFYLTYNKTENNWYMNVDGQEKKLIHFNGDGTIKAFLNNGLTVDVTPDAMGVYQLRQAQAGTSYFMAAR